MFIILEDIGGVGKIPYQALQEQTISIEAAGLPTGIILKKPSFYGRKQLNEILEAKDQISFRVGK